MKALNPSTGNLEEIYVKALDSMPVGTQIEYTGDTIPTGWEEVNDYSSTEIDTGKKWIDGKSIYRKVILETMPANQTTKETNLNITDTIYEYVSVYVKIIPSGSSTNNTACVSYYNNSSDFLRWYLSTPSEKQITVTSGSDWPKRPYNYAIIVEYTKIS